MNDPEPPPITANRSLRPNISITGFNAISFLLCQIVSDRLNNQFMILFLWKSRNRDRTYDASVFENDRKTTTVRSIFTFRYQIRLFNGLALAFEQLSDIERTVSKPINSFDFSLHPFVIIRGCAAQAGMEKLMCSPHNIYRDRRIPAARTLNKLTAKFPGNIFIELGELKFLFLLKQLLQYVVHINILWRYWERPVITSQSAPNSI